MNLSRPKNLNLFTIRFPLPAIISIMHRLSGICLFLLIPAALWCLNVSLTDTGFEKIQTALGGTYAKFICWLIFMPFCFHFVAGIRHLLMDAHVGSSLKGGRRSALLTLIISIIIVILAGIWLW